MERIIKYNQQDDGRYTVIVENVTLGNDETLMIDNGLTVGVDVSVQNPFKITTPQRKKIFALCRDIDLYTGQPMEDIRRMFQQQVQIMHGYEGRISLASCSKRTAGLIIDYILEFVFRYDIPLNYETSDLLKNDLSFLYFATINRQCVICGAENADLAHREAVGAGRDRRKVDHTNSRVLALCRSHHQMQHKMGVDSFDKKYHLEKSWLKPDDRLNKMLKGQKVD